MSISEAAESSKIEKTNKEELRNFLLEGLTIYHQKILPEIKETFSNPDFETFSKFDFSTIVYFENKIKSLFKLRTK